MLVYRDSASPMLTREWLQQLAWRARSDGASLEQARELCVEFGEVEAAVVDCVCTVADGCTPLTRALRRTGAELAANFLAWFEGDTQRAEACLVRAQQALAGLLEHELPSSVRAKAPEGFAYYGLYPEQYLRSAELAFHHCRPHRAVVLGLRSIGTTLSSVVEAYLARRACRASSYAVRPRGEPFARKLQLEPALQAELQAKTDAWFFIVDEGPGLSGSSLTCVALELRRLGVERSRIVLLPGYQCDGTHFVNPSARQTWQEHARFVADFERAWLSGLPRGAEVRELSAGAWRQELAAEGEDIACHPQHERRKYLVSDGRGGSFILRFAGLGSQGRRARARAVALEPSGVAPRVLGFADGMLALEHIPARISASPPTGRSFTEALVGYLAFRRQHLDTGERSTLEALAEMAQQNIGEALGAGACQPLAALLARARSAECHATIADARLMPHEWLTTPTGYRKVDGLDHGDDHFYPGPCDIAWDLAGAMYELALDAPARQRLLSRYLSATGDSSMPQRIPFFELAYLAHRLGYAGLSARTLGAPFAGLERRYLRALRARLQELRS